ncbi:MAG TPA: acyclic terpene utilization AtuA family protein [Roseiarcus sp.]|nr:acyclic terpene utilization AtuA family protein [Roseiarcus sp.]
MRTVRIGAGAGFSGDRIEPAVELAERGELDYLVFECLAERTIALAQQARRADPDKGYDPLLDRRMRAVLPAAARNGVSIVTNMGAANPLAAARRIAAIAAELGLPSLKIAAVVGDDVLAALMAVDAEIAEIGAPLSRLGTRVVSANAYLGADAIVTALRAGANVVVTGRTADPALFLGPLIHAFGWRQDDWARLGAGALAGHLLECAGQISGGYFADPPLKSVAGLARLGFPLAEVDEAGGLVVTKLAGSGGAITAATCKEQLLYEIHDPAAYLQPDVIADFSAVVIEEIAPDRVRVSGATGRARPPTLKVSVGYLDGWIGEGQISYAGTGAEARGRLALDIVAERLALTGAAISPLRCDLIGVDALHGARGGSAYEVRARAVGCAGSAIEAARIGEEVEALYTNGPAGGGGVMKSVREVVAVGSAYLRRELAPAEVQFVESDR